MLPTMTNETRLRLLAQELLREASRCDYQVVIASHVSPGVVGPVIELTPLASDGVQNTGGESHG